MPQVPKTKGPRFVRYFGPLVDALKELGGSARPAEVKSVIATNLSLPEDFLNQRNKSGLLRFRNDVDWARFYLVHSGYIDASSRGVWSLTDKGYSYSLSHDEAVELFKAVHKDFVVDKKAKSTQPQPEDDSDEEEEVALATETGHRDAMLALLRELPPAGFERLCQRILREAGFESVTITGRTGDGGLDGMGILQVNPLVSFKVLFQCKRYSGDVTPSQVRDFRGAMQGRADKGIILTTGSFGPQARNEALREGVPPIELVDAEKLLDMLEDLQLGFKPKRAFDIDESFIAQFK
jgi:restriction system protein